MEKVNVYDWDKTIFPVDSTAAFYGWCIKCFPKVLLAGPATVAMLPKYWAKKCTKTRIKERFYGFLRYVPDIDRAVEAFWDEYFPRVNQWYLDHMQPDDMSRQSAWVCGCWHRASTRTPAKLKGKTATARKRCAACARHTPRWRSESFIPIRSPTPRWRVWQKKRFL